MMQTSSFIFTFGAIAAATAAARTWYGYSAAVAGLRRQVRMLREDQTRRIEAQPALTVAQGGGADRARISARSRTARPDGLLAAA